MTEELRRHETVCTGCDMLRCDMDGDLMCFAIATGFKQGFTVEEYRRNTGKKAWFDRDFDGRPVPGDCRRMDRLVTMQRLREL